jgi:hypothetical protein
MLIEIVSLSPSLSVADNSTSSVSAKTNKIDKSTPNNPRTSLRTSATSSRGATDVTHNLYGQVDTSRFAGKSAQRINIVQIASSSVEHVSDF